MYFKLASQRFFYKIPQTRQAYAFWNEANTLAINTERTKCVLLTSDETLQCMNPVTGFCSIKSPIHVNPNATHKGTLLDLDNKQ